MSSRTHHGFRKAFTLVELLVVIGIIAILIAMLLPALQKVKESGNAIKCQNNMKQIFMAFLLFSQDHKGHLPGNKHDTGNPDWEKTDWLGGTTPLGGTRYLSCPQKGTIYRYLTKASTNPNAPASTAVLQLFSCPSAVSAGQVGGSSGTNERFDYAVFGSFAGAKLSQIKKTASAPAKGGKREIVPTPILVQEDAKWINGSNLEGGHSYPDQLAHVHNKGSYYITLDGSTFWYNEPADTDGGRADNWFVIPPSGKNAPQGVSIGLDYTWNQWGQQ